MMPLWMRASLPSSPRCGCALPSVGPPCVAQRVWPMPVRPSVQRVRLEVVGEHLRACRRACAVPMSPSSSIDGDAGGVVAAVLEAAKAAHEHVEAACARRRIPTIPHMGSILGGSAERPPRRLDAPTLDCHGAGSAEPVVARRADLAVRRARPGGLGGPRPVDAARRSARPRSSSSAASASRSTCARSPRSTCRSAACSTSTSAARSRCTTSTSEFLRERVESTPFVIGVAGSVAVGKSTIARLLRELLARWEHTPARRAGHHRRLPASRTPSSSDAASWSARDSPSPTTAGRCCGS